MEGIKKENGIRKTGNTRQEAEKQSSCWYSGKGRGREGKMGRGMFKY